MTFTFLQDSRTLDLSVCQPSTPFDDGSRSTPRQREPHAHGHERRAELDGEAGGQNARATKEFPAAHFHIITTNMTAIIAENAITGATSGLSHVTLRMLSGSFL
jgi:hypothetical protein